MAKRRTGKSRVYLFSLVSGMIWGVIALLLGSRPLGGLIWGGVLGSPLIGLIAGWAAMQMKPRTKLAAAGISLASLYLSASLFGISVGLFDWLTGNPQRNALELILQPVPAILWGLTFTAYVAALWPLAYWNHVLLWKTVERNVRE
jgi:hypothetical protein